MNYAYLALLLLVFAHQPATAQTPARPYDDHARLTARLRALVAGSGGAAGLQSVGKSVGGKDIWLLTLGRGAAANKPALAVVAGLDGTHLAGTELAVQIAEKLLANPADSIVKLLASRTIYVLPLVNPDAQEQAFATLKYERTGNARDTDDDRDGRLNEDPYEDLNRDGLITQVRIEDPTGQYVTSKDDPRVLVRADPARGEVGRYILISEGVDSDRDGQFNEDGPGGIALDRNFTFDYPFFSPGAGEMPVSEPENRALLDFLYKTPNVFAVFTFGPYNNLSDAPKFDRVKATKRIIAGVLEKDVIVGEQVGKLYAAQTGLKDAPPMPATKGNFAQTAYYHYGRFSFSTPGWWVPKLTPPKDTTKKADVAKPSPPASGSSTPGSDEVSYLKWAEANGVPKPFVAWTPIQHPDFPGRTAEVGGIVPFARLNPPVSFLTDAADRHTRFLLAFSRQMPAVEIVNVRTEMLGGGVSRVTAQVVNRGLLPTGAEMGDKVRWVPKLRIELVTTDKQTVISGRRRILRGPMNAGETMDVTFLVTGSGRATLEAGNAMIGVQQVPVTLN
jgi:Zinc carboxypeptidase